MNEIADGPTLTVEQLFAAARAVLRQGGIEHPDIDAKAIFLSVLGLTWQEFIVRGQEAIGVEAAEAIQKLCDRRLTGEPLAYLIGEKEFWGLPFAVDSTTLIPRPDSEIIVEAAIAQLSVLRASKRQSGEDGYLRVLDLGTGSGALLLAIIHSREDCLGVGLDIQAGAVQKARKNAENLGLSERCLFVQADWRNFSTEALQWVFIGQNRPELPRFDEFFAKNTRFDMVVANPPYIIREDLDKLPVDVSKFEPRIALDGGEDGLECYRQLRFVLAEWLCPGGYFILEHGYDQQKNVTDIVFANPELRFSRDLKDLSGLPRAVAGYRSFS